jgi:uncharacterized membrane protein YhaH (DUF805 family)
MLYNTYILRKIIVFLLCLSSVFCWAQTPQNADSTSNELEDNNTREAGKSPKSLVEDFMKAEKEKKVISAPQVNAGDSYATDGRLDSIRLEAWKQYYGYMTKGYIHRSNVFTWQLLSSIIIFSVVIFLVFAGIYFAWLQFKASLYGKSEDSGQLSTELSASMKEIKVSSPVLGVIILVISLFFFYLYLIYVYPIQEIF